jgi:drug/metabolite transporter (DMT)-like permease
MPRLLQISLIVLAVIAVAVADAFLKKASAEGTLRAALQSPWMLGAALLYLFQILFFTYMFVAGWQLSLVGSLQTVFYALVVVLAGIFIFRESLTLLQSIGVGLALVGATLINLPSGGL